MPTLELMVLPATVYDALTTNATTATGGLGDIQRMAGTVLTARDIGASVLLSSGTGTGQIVLNSGVADARLADAVSHGGTLGSSTATLALSRLNVTSQTSNTNAVTATGNGTGHGAAFTSGSGATGNGLTLLAASTNGHGLKSTGTGAGDGCELTAGASGADLDADIAGTLTTVTTLTNAPSDSSGVTTLLSRIGGAITITSGRVNADVTHIAAAAVSASTAQLGVNVVNFGGSAGTFASGRPEVNTSHIAGSVVSTTTAQIGVNVVQLSGDATAADNAESFFDGTGYAGTNNVIPLVTTTTTVTNQLTGAQVATAVWTDTTAGDFTVALSVGKSLMNGVTLGTGLTVARCTLTDTLTTYTGNTVQTGDSFARLGATGSGLTSLAPSATALSTAQWTNTLATNLGTTNTTVAANLDAAVSSRLAPTTAGRTLDVTATGEAGIDWGNIGNKTSTVLLSATTVARASTVTGFGGGGGVGEYIFFDGTIPADQQGQSTISGDFSVDYDNQYVGSVLAIEHGDSTHHFVAQILGSTVSPKRLILDRAIPSIGYADPIPYLILPGPGLVATAAQNQAGLATSAALATVAGYVDTEVAAIKAKTDNLPAAPAAVGDIPTVSQIWTTALAEAYRATAATGTGAQLLYEILQNIVDFAISGTTKSVKNIAGATAKTYTLDSAVTPTSITEAT